MSTNTVNGEVFISQYRGSDLTAQLSTAGVDARVDVWHPDRSAFGTALHAILMMFGA